MATSTTAGAFLGFFSGAGTLFRGVRLLGILLSSTVSAASWVFYFQARSLREVSTTAAEMVCGVSVGSFAGATGGLVFRCFDQRRHRGRFHSGHSAILRDSSGFLVLHMPRPTHPACGKWRGVRSSRFRSASLFWHGMLWRGFAAEEVRRRRLASGPRSSLRRSCACSVQSVFVESLEEAGFEDCENTTCLHRMPDQTRQVIDTCS